ncbi:hypothetical protein JRO89_XS13G0165100 [Xanthoceras sorbifolium]|uniref:Mur ligase central domain-containing protein n=1 Tax=Xanthoceras sorbifolium TaxID=99658 RepID=A0ABQ8H8M8_9ROSI|nr:hypothetical protein JRO89_XS13G0165100 [Xanthoceras sorbifolium]
MWETNTVHLAIRMWETHRLTACARDFFVCCVGKKTDGHLFYIEAYRRGAVAVIPDEEFGRDWYNWHHENNFFLFDKRHVRSDGIEDWDVELVFTSLTRDHLDFHGTEEEYRDAKAMLFARVVDPQRHRKILEVSSGLLGRHSIYSILVAVAVGIAVGAPLEDIVRGIEEVDAVPGKVELIDEEQAYGVIVDYARTPDALLSLKDA